MAENFHPMPFIAFSELQLLYRAFQNSRILAKQGLHLAFLEALQQENARSSEHAAACCSAIKKLAVNEELCCQLAEAGGVQAAMQVMDLFLGSARLCAYVRKQMLTLVNEPNVREGI